MSWKSVNRMLVSEGRIAMRHDVKRKIFASSNCVVAFTESKLRECNMQVCPNALNEAAKGSINQKRWLGQTICIAIKM